MFMSLLLFVQEGSPCNKNFRPRFKRLPWLQIANLFTLPTSDDQVLISLALSKEQTRPHQHANDLFFNLSVSTYDLTTDPFINVLQQNDGLDISCPSQFREEKFMATESVLCGMSENWSMELQLRLGLYNFPGSREARTACRRVH